MAVFFDMCFTLQGVVHWAYKAEDIKLEGIQGGYNSKKYRLCNMKNKK